MNKYSLIKGNFIGFFILSFLLTLCSTAFPAAEIQDTKSKLHKDVQTLLHENKFSELEKMADQFRTEKTRFHDGEWKLYYFYETFREPFYGWDETVGNIDKWMKKYPRSMNARIAAAETWIFYGWKARGTGYSKTVTEEGRKLWKERIAKAYEFIGNEPENSSQDCIHRYYLLLKIGRAQRWDRQQYETLFQKAISFEPSYYPVYYEKAHNLLPRWGGSDGEWQKFAAEAVNLTPKSEGMGIYARILDFVWGAGEFREFNDPDISWEKMNQGFRDIERSFRNSSVILNKFCFFACLAGDRNTAIELFKRIGDEPDTEIWKGRTNFYKWQKWAGLND